MKDEFRILFIGNLNIARGKMTPRQERRRTMQPNVITCIWFLISIVNALQSRIVVSFKTVTLSSLRDYPRTTRSLQAAQPNINAAVPPTVSPTRDNANTSNSTGTQHNRTNKPTSITSDAPSRSPTSIINSTSHTQFHQKFVLPGNWSFFDETEIQRFVGVVEGYTDKFAPDNETIDNITTTCAVTGQNGAQRYNQTVNEVQYSCAYFSNVTNVSNFTELYIEYVNNNLEEFTANLQNASVHILDSRPVYTLPAPTLSPRPTGIPTLQPTTTFPPSGIPSRFPSASPVEKPQPTNIPTMAEEPIQPTYMPTFPPQDRRLSVGAIAAIVVLGGFTVLGMLICYYVSWKRKHLILDDDIINDPSIIEPTEMHRTAQRPNGIWTSRRDTDDEVPGQPVISPTESFMTSKSLISAGNSGLAEESGDEEDGTNDLQDEFDKYRDQNLEQFRDDVEGKVTGMEGVMSAAVTMAHMIDDSKMLDENELRWGCDANCQGIDIEASALYEVSDWLKRNENTPSERRRAFMEEILNKMVTSVKNGVLNADDGSRTIHEAAAILGLHLAEPLPMTTVVISGMRLTATADDLAGGLREFGDVDIVAVAPGSKGFGIVRFRRPKSVDRAMRRYSTSEIIIQDVAVQMKVLTSTAVYDSRVPDIIDNT